MLPGPTLIITCPRCNAPHRTGTLQSGNTIGAVYWSDGKMVAPMLPEEPSFTKCTACGSFCWVSDMPQVGQWAPWDDAPCRDPLSFDVAITEIWEGHDPIAERLAVQLGCNLQEAKAKLHSLPTVLGQDVARAAANALEKAFGELEVNVELTPCRVSTEPVPPEWFKLADIPFLSESDYMTALEAGLARNVEDEVFLRIAAWHASNDGFRDGNTPWTPYAERNGSSVENLERLLDLLDKTKGASRLMSAEICRQLCRFDEVKRWLDASVLESSTYYDESEKSSILHVAHVILELADRGDSALSQLNLEHE